MKTQILPRVLPLFLLAAATTAFADPEVKKDVVIRRGSVQGGPHFNLLLDESCSE